MDKPFTSRGGAPFIKVCGMTTPSAVSAALACEVDAIGFVFAPSVRRVSPLRAAELATPARHKTACVAVTRHPSRADIDEILRDFRPDILQTDIDDIKNWSCRASSRCCRCCGPVPDRPARSRAACCSKGR